MNLEKFGSTRRRFSLAQAICEMVDAREETPAVWPAWLPIRSAFPEPTEQCWVVWEVDWGGQIAASCPLSVILRSVGGDLARAHETVCRMMHEVRAHAFSDGWSFYGVTLRPEERRFEEIVPGSVPRPEERYSMGSKNGLAGWTVHGYLSGGMGGGALIDSDLWLHEHVLVQGVDVVNRFRTLVGLPALAGLDMVWVSEEDRWHAEFCRAIFYS